MPDTRPVNARPANPFAPLAPTGPVRVTTGPGNDCLVLYRDDTTGNHLAKRPGEWPARKTHPIAVMAHDGQVTRLTHDPLPDPDDLDRFLAVLRHRLHRENTPVLDAETAARSAQSGTVLAVDVSGSEDPDRCTRWARAFQGHGHAVLLFGERVTPAATGPDVLAGSGAGASGDARVLQRHIDAMDPHPTAVVVLTDGCLPRSTPAHPDLWTWALTPMNGRSNMDMDTDKLPPMLVIDVD